MTDGTDFTAADDSWELDGDVLVHRSTYRSGAEPTVTNLITVRYSPAAWHSITETKAQASPAKKP